MNLYLSKIRKNSLYLQGGPFSTEPATVNQHGKTKTLVLKFAYHFLHF